MVVYIIPFDDMTRSKIEHMIILDLSNERFCSAAQLQNWQTSGGSRAVTALDQRQHLVILIMKRRLAADYGSDCRLRSTFVCTLRSFRRSALFFRTVHFQMLNEECFQNLHIPGQQNFSFFKQGSTERRNDIFVYYQARLCFHYRDTWHYTQLLYPIPY
ncbi:hypothetical protein D3C71_1304620 [compost metagenome]